MLIRYDLFSPGHGLVFRVLDLHTGDLRSIHALNSKLNSKPACFLNSQLYGCLTCCVGFCSSWDIYGRNWLHIIVVAVMLGNFSNDNSRGKENVT